MLAGTVGVGMVTDNFTTSPASIDTYTFFHPAQSCRFSSIGQELRRDAHQMHDKMAAGSSLQFCFSTFSGHLECHRARNQSLIRYSECTFKVCIVRKLVFWVPSQTPSHLFTRSPSAYNLRGILQCALTRATIRK